MISIPQAYQFLQSTVQPLDVEQVRLSDAVHRILAEPVMADVDSPPHRKSLMDGYAVRSQDINQGLNRLKVIETIVAGGWPTRPVGPQEAARIMTGAPIPDGADAVVMIEATQTDAGEEGTTENLSAHSQHLTSSHSGGVATGSAGCEWVNIKLVQIDAGKHIANRADNFAKGQVILPAGHRVHPWNVGLLAEVGSHRVHVYRQPNIAILATGDELVECDQLPQPGQIRNSNGPQLLALAQQASHSVELLPIGRDNEADLVEKINLGLDADLLILTGGVSAGLLDLVPQILQRLGVHEIFHKINIKPGKPIWFGVRKGSRNCYVFGLPGNPVSSLVGFHLFVKSAIRIMQRTEPLMPVSVKAELTQEHVCRGGRPTYWPGCSVSNESTVRQVTPLDWHGSSDLLSLGEADGLIAFPGDRTCFNAGELVEYLPLAID